MRRDTLVALGLFAITLAILVAGMSTNDGCEAESFWTTYYWELVLAPYVVAATLSFAGGTYFSMRATDVRRRFAFLWAVVALLLAGPGIWVLAIIDGLAACPP